MGNKLNLEKREISQEAEDLVNLLLDKYQYTVEEVAEELIMGAAYAGVETESIPEMLNYLATFVEEVV